MDAGRSATLRSGRRFRASARSNPMAYDIRQEAILKAAAALFATKGYERTSIRDIARAARMSVAGLYYYVRSKEELLYRICDRSFSVILDTLERELARTPDPQARVRVLIRNHLEHFLHHMNEIKVMTRELGALREPHATDIGALRRRYYAICRDVLAGLGSSVVSPRLAAMSLFGMINWIQMWYRPGLDGGADTLAEGMASIFLDGYARTRGEGDGRRDEGDRVQREWAGREDRP